MTTKKWIVFAVVLLVTIPPATQGLRAQSTQPNQRMDNFYERTSPAQREIIPYDHIREADVFWHRRVWRVIDSREKMNLPFKYEGLDWKDISPLIDILRNSIQSGELTVFDEDNFLTTKTWDQVSQIGAGTDTVPIYDLDGNPIGDTVTHRIFNPSLVYKWRIKEDWFFDEETSTMQCRILSLAPIYYDEDARMEIPMFWAYFPDLRPILVKNDVFNMKNDADRLSWDDLFEMRFFSSTIYKESNVFDRRIQEYATGIDALRESDRIKNDIFNFEHDLWSF